VNSNFIMKFANIFAATCLVLIMQGCTSIPKSESSAKTDSLKLYQLHQENIKAIGQFSLKGRIGVQSEGKGFSGGINWQHDNTKDVIGLYSPLGGQVASINKTSDKVTLEDSKGNSISALDAESLTQQTLGWQLPLSGLADWTIGSPTSGPIQNSTWDKQGYLTTLRQDGWDIEYQNYSQQNGHFLPGKITLKNEKVNLKLIVENWIIIDL